MKVLIVDDELLIRRSLMRLFTQRGHEVIEAENGLVAVKVWKKEKPDLVLLDFMMPGLNGLEVLKEIDSKIKKNVVIMSAYVGSNEYKDFAQLGATRFYSKPFDDIFKFVEEMEGLNDGQK